MITIHPDPVPLRVDDTGTIRVADTRITLDVLLGFLLNGVKPEELTSDAYYPFLSLADVHAILAYYFRHQTEVDAYLKVRREAAERLQREIEATHPSFEEVKARLLAKRNAAHASSAD